MERMSGPMLVVWVAGYTMRQIAQHWKQTFGNSHSLHSNIGSILWSGTKKPTAGRLPSNANIGSWPFVIKVQLHDTSNVGFNVGSKRLGQYGANVGASVGGAGCRLHDASNNPTLEANTTVCIPTLEASFEAGQKNRQSANYLPMPMLEAGRSSFVIRTLATWFVECFQCPTLEVFDALCSHGLILTQSWL